jgi:hypothetical protein
MLRPYTQFETLQTRPSKNYLLKSLLPGIVHWQALVHNSHNKRAGVEEYQWL